VKIRNRITLWITGAGLLAALLFSVIISYELIEQPFEILDRELDSQAYIMLAGLSPQDGRLVSQLNPTILGSLGRLYWFKLFNQDQKLIYASDMTAFVDLPVPVQEGKNEHYTVNMVVPHEVTNLELKANDEVTFRVHVVSIPFGKSMYLVQIARPMDKLHEEIIDLVISIVVGLAFFALALLLLGYLVAGKVLQPIAEINTLAREINDKTLDKRIPLGENQDEIYALSSSLNQMFDRLQFSFKRQKEFIANASHELKTPIAMQRLFFDEAVQRDDLPENFKTKLEVQSDVTRRMNQLVKNLLDLSVLERNERLDSNTINLTKLSASVFEEFDEIIQAAGIRLSLNINVAASLSADREKIRRVLINIIDNAIKYNLKENGEIRFSLNQTDNKVEMKISNTGQAIPKDRLNQVFNQFYRVEKSRSVVLGGSGLGLTIVKRIVELHHGTVVIKSESEPEGWIHLIISLPDS